MARSLPTEMARPQIHQVGKDPLKPQEPALPAAALGHPRKRVPLGRREGAPGPPVAGQARGEWSGWPVRLGGRPRTSSLPP